MLRLSAANVCHSHAVCMYCEVVNLAALLLYNHAKQCSLTACCFISK